MDGLAILTNALIAGRRFYGGEGGCFLAPFMCGGDHRWGGGVIILQVWVGVAVSSLS